SRAVRLCLVAGAVTVVTLHRMDAWFHSARPTDLPSAPRHFAPLIHELDRLGLDRVYADYWIAYRLDFATRERIIAVENSSPEITFRGDLPVPSPNKVRYRPYEDAVEASRRPGFVYFRKTLDQWPIVPALLAHGYRQVPVGPFVVLAPPSS